MKIVHIFVILFVISLVANMYLYIYWYDHEYPHGNKQISCNKIVFSKDWYSIVDYVNFGKNCYEIQDFNVEKRLYNLFDSWINVSYKVVKTNDPYYPETIFYINDSRTFFFNVEYHTYDALSDGIDVSYYKQKVIDGLDIGGWVS